MKLKMERDPSWAGKTQAIKPSHVVSAARQTGMYAAVENYITEAAAVCRSRAE